MSPTCFSVCFSKAFPNGEYVNLAGFIIGYSFISIFPDDMADVFAASLLKSYCSFSSLILSSILVISFYILCKRFFLKREELLHT